MPATAAADGGYEFAVDFFTGREQQLSGILASIGKQPDDQLRILEIGSFEGRSACWFSDHWLDHPSSHLTCIDTFEGGDEHQKFLVTEHPDVLRKFLSKADLETICRSNVAKSKNADKVVIRRALYGSAYELPQLLASAGKAAFDIIYIDGSHHSEDVLLDGVNSWHLLKDGGVLIFDDYDKVCFNDRVDIDTFPVQRAADTLQAFFCLRMISDGFAAPHGLRALQKVPGAYPLADLPMGLARRAQTLHSAQRDVEALDCLEQALRLEPDFVGAMFQKGIIHLAHGDFANGWPLFELRRARTDAALSGVRYQEHPRWDGQVTDKRVILWAEEGLGDTIQMLRYVPEAISKCPNLILEVQPTLVRLCQQNFSCEVVAHTGEPRQFDLQSPLLSPPLGPLPIPAAPYLSAPEMVAPTQHRIGIAWHGNPAHEKDKQRSIPFAALQDLATEFDFLSLQLEDLKAEDIAATAAVIKQLDLVITVDSLIAHLAGALGTETWVLLPVDCDWRWQQKRRDSPWYRSARLFRQTVSGDWNSVLAIVAHELRLRHSFAYSSRLLSEAA